MLRRILAVLSVLALYACDSGAGPNAVIGVGSTNSIAGTYSLRTVNGASLPFTYAREGPDTYEVLDDAISLTDGGTWSEVWHERHTVDGVVTNRTFSDGGTFTRSGTTLTFAATTPSTGQPSFQGSLNGSTLSLTGVSHAGVTLALIYVK